MKHTLLVMGLTLGLCPAWAAAQVVGDGGATAEDSITENWTGGGENPWATDPESSPNAAPGTEWASVLAYDFRGSSEFSFIASEATNLWCTAPASGAYAYAHLNIQQNRKIHHFRLWGFDNSAGDMVAKLHTVCLPMFGSAGSTTNTLLAELDSVGVSGAFSRSVQLIPAPSVDTSDCTLWASITFSKCEDAAHLTLRKIFVEYTR